MINNERLPQTVNIYIYWFNNSYSNRKKKQYEGQSHYGNIIQNFSIYATKQIFKIRTDER